MKQLHTKPKVVKQGEKLRGADKTSRIPVKIDPKPKDQRLRKPKWIRASFTGTREIAYLKKILRSKGLHTVCEEAACPNLGECFSNGTATFLIMGDICTRRCPFCDIAHGRPHTLDPDEPLHLAETVETMKLKYVVITSVDRDDLRDGGAAHFGECIKAVKKQCPKVKIEILTPDFRGRIDIALDILKHTPIDVFNHNLETVPRLYKKVRPGSDYHYSLQLLLRVKAFNKNVTTKSGIMLGLGEEKEEIIEVMSDLRKHEVDRLTLGQYLQPSSYHLAVERYWSPEKFRQLEQIGKSMGFSNVISAPMVRSSYHADLQAQAHS